MRTKNLCLLGLSALLLGGTLGLASCNNENEPTVTPDPGEGDNPGGEVEESVIKSLTAKESEVGMKLGDTVAYSQFYNLVGNKTLTTKQKRVTVTSSDPTIVEVAGTTLRALSLGNVKIEVVSQADETKKCSFNITVTDVYFDREISSSLSSEDDFSKELKEDGGIVRTGSSSTLDLFVKSAATSKAYIEGKIQWKGTSINENFPKMGIVFSTMNNPVVEETMSDNRIVFFFNPEKCHEGTTFDKMGVCEVQNSGNWAWNPGVSNDMARHMDNAFTLENPIGIDGSFKIAVARDKLDFHVWINDTYAYSLTSLHDLFSADSGDTPALTNFGFFEFNSDIIVSEYDYTTVESEVDSKINSITSLKKIGEVEGFDWAAD
ncbi:MAG: hypothetical protein MSS80_00815 [Mollicutes bacterium]|nr:hypothetical protein [Mollicutes bacterium]